ncbi:MAG: leucyl aminopeptidase [Nocardioidaceae bacterium]
MALPSQVSPPEFALSDVAPTHVVGADVVAVPVLSAAPDEDGPTLGPGAAELMEELGEDLFALLDVARATGRAGEVTERAVLDASGLANTELSRVLLVGVGTGSTDDVRRAGAALARATRHARTLATSVPALSDDAGLRAFVEGLVLGSFEFHWRSDGPLNRPVERVVLAGIGDPQERKPALDRALAIAGAGWTSRTLALVPSNVKNPVWMVEQAAEAAARAGLAITVWDEKQLADQGFGGIVGVGQASVHPPRFVRLDYKPRKANRRTPHVALVGKGITFDTGGLSIKPRDNMMLMKRDMTGAGVVLAVMAALADVDCPVRVTGLLPLAENAVSGSAMRPGDVLRHYGGRTSEVTNTDAEGRLVLADALAYAVAEVKPDVLVDVATLTGAMKIALGQRTGGYFATDEALAGLLRTASLAAGEPLWRMPLVDDYEDRISSPVADADNSGGMPGAITAALFLRHFTGGLPWAHLDIASVGDSPTDAFEYTKGATGFGARALLHWLELRDPLAGVGGRPVPGADDESTEA